MSSEILNIETERDVAHLVESVGRLLERVDSVCQPYRNSTPVAHLPDLMGGDGGSEFSTTVELGLKDLYVLAAICQAPLGLQGGTDRGKTALASMALQAIFGNHGESWWRNELSAGTSMEDLLDIDLKKLSESKLSEALSAAPWLSYPGFLLDELNRCPSKLSNHMLHIIDGSGLHVKGNLYLPVGMPYKLDGKEKRYSFTTTTMNPEDYDGTYDVDPAIIRRIVLSVDLDDVPPTAQDKAYLVEHGRPKLDLSPQESMVEDVIRVYESLPNILSFAPLAKLFLHYLAGLNTCVRTRSGHVQPRLQPAICEECHLHETTRFCGRVSGLSEGLLLWTKEAARGIAAIRAARVLQNVHKDCLAGPYPEVQKLLGTRKKGKALYRAFAEAYLPKLSVSGEDVVAAYTLIAPGHVYADPQWLASQEAYENRATYVFADVAASSWERFQGLLIKHQHLFEELAADRELSPARQAEIEELVTTEDAAMFSVISALRSNPLPLNFREAVKRHHAA